VKKLALGLGLVVFAGLGTVLAWKIVGSDSSEGALTLAEQPRTIQPVPDGARLTSPNGDYEIAVTDDGITWKGPGGSISVTPGGVTVKSNTQLPIQGAAALSLEAAQVRLCGGSGGRQLARVGDFVSAGPIITPAGPVPQPGPIVQGSPKVLAC
jgi:hypothetical protein